MREYWVHEDGSFGGSVRLSQSDALTDEEIVERYEQLARDYWLAQFEPDPIDAIKPREGEDVLAWIMRTRSMTFPDAVHYVANDLLEGDRDA